MSTASNLRELQRLAEQAQRVIDMPPNPERPDEDEWEVKYELVFAIARDVRELGFRIEYCDPDTSYEEDARAYASALERFAASRSRYLEVL